MPSCRAHEGPDKFYKRRIQEKTHRPSGRTFSCFSAPRGRARFVLPFRAICSVAGPCDPVLWVFSTSGFHRSFATKPVSSETSRAERRSVRDHSSIRDSWPIAFSGLYCVALPRQVLLDEIYFSGTRVNQDLTDSAVKSVKTSTSSKLAEWNSG
jgi:hypothetical protein